ncbi:MAG: tRNA (adenosine(37)-N6)-threonylcarbamoyltransferase complex dimerization subunit type 1 TsaB [Actinobacteria bacterium]|nr:tRNA (adenosine(37)-N6)-threonylcarbamoyltransferase complex dimerization subunit type 1 TsaB [Actinomycetota bacterium]
MILLAISTSAATVGVAVADGTGVLAAEEAASDRAHAELLPSVVGRALAAASVGFADLGCIAVDVGPGWFTGLRVGIAAAKSFAEVLDLPVVAVGSHEVLAATSPTDRELIVPVTDARRGEVAWSVFGAADGRQLVAERTGPPAECAHAVNGRGQPARLAGAGAVRHRDALVAELAVPADVGPTDDAPVAISALARIAWTRMLRDEAVRGDDVVPRYLRAPDVTIQWSTRSGR